jgi:hypothetical protein
LGAATPLQPHADKAELVRCQSVGETGEIYRFSSHLAPLLYSQPKHPDSASGFRGLREPHAFWYDNTRALFYLLSKATTLRKTLLTRPPRMGKTIFCEMLGTYVDCKTPEVVFDQCFRDTYILRAEDDVNIEEDHKASLLALKRKCCWLPLVSSGKGVG